MVLIVMCWLWNIIKLWLIMVFFLFCLGLVYVELFFIFGRVYGGKILIWVNGE